MSLIVVSVITLWKQIVSSNCTSLTLSPLHLHFLPWSSSPLVRARVMDAGPFKQIRPRTVLSFLLHITLWFVSAIITCDSGSCFQLSLSLPIFHFSCHLDSCFTVNRVDYCSSFYCVPLWFRLQPLKGLLRRLSILLVVSLDPSVCETSSTIQQLSSASIIARSPLSPSTAFPPCTCLVLTGPAWERFHNRLKWLDCIHATRSASIDQWHSEMKDLSVPLRQIRHFICHCSISLII